MLTGENGAAKTTLLRNVLGLLKPDEGSVELAKKNADGRELSIGYVPQQVASFNVGFPSTVLELVESGRYPKGRWFKPLTKRDKTSKTGTRVRFMPDDEIFSTTNFSSTLPNSLDDELINMFSLSKFIFIIFLSFP